MKKAIATALVMIMMLALGTTAFAVNAPLTLDQAKQAALSCAGVNASDASFTKAYKGYDDGREVFEIEFYANNTEYDMDVDVNTGRVTDFSTEYHGGYTQPGSNGGFYGYDDDRYDWDDRYDDWDDRYDYDDGWFDWDD